MKESIAINSIIFYVYYKQKIKKFYFFDDILFKIYLSVIIDKIEIMFKIIKNNFFL